MKKFYITLNQKDVIFFFIKIDCKYKLDYLLDSLRIMFSQTVEGTGYDTTHAEEIDCAKGGSDKNVPREYLNKIKDNIYYYRKFEGGASLDSEWNVTAELIDDCQDGDDESKCNQQFNVNWSSPKNADPEWDEEFENNFKKDTQRFSWEGSGIISYDDNDGRPLIPLEKNNLPKGRGVLWFWGPNKAVDALITRENPETSRLQILVVRRQDTGEWAIPGGMLPLGQEDDIHIVGQAIQELKEEALSKMTEIESKEFDNILQSVTYLYQGYMPDPRNLRNAWIETTGVYCHLPNNLSSKLILEPKENEDTTHAVWADIDKEKKLLLVNNDISKVDPQLQVGEELPLYAGHTENYINTLFLMYEDTCSLNISDIVQIIFTIYIVSIMIFYFRNYYF